MGIGLVQHDSPQVFHQLRQDDLRLLAHADHIVHCFDDDASPPLKHGVRQGKQPVPADESQQIPNEALVDLPVGVANALVQHAQGVAHAAVGLDGQDMGGSLRQADMLLLCHVHQPGGDVGAGNTAEFIPLAPRQYRHGNPFRLRRRQNEYDVGRRLFQRFQQGVEGFRRQHVHFVDNVYLLMAFGRHKFDRFPQCPDVLDAAVGRGVDFHDVHRLAAQDMAAYFAFVAGMGRRAMDAVHGPGEDFSRTGLARPPGAGK